MSGSLLVNTLILAAAVGYAVYEVYQMYNNSAAPYSNVGNPPRQNSWNSTPRQGSSRQSYPDDVCAICYEDYEYRRRIELGCGHFFHRDCINKVENKICPVCRQKF